jgi:hypothetical protein
MRPEALGCLRDAASPEWGGFPHQARGYGSAIVV